MYSTAAGHGYESLGLSFDVSILFVNTFEIL